MHRRGSGWTAKAASSTNIFVEQLWRSLEYECVYLHASVPACWETGSERPELALENASRFTTTSARILRLAANHLP
ncbi:MAG: hypothetical protein ACJA0F_002501 [Dinoroseobacter sp.]|jgi:hypothetical protein